MKTILTINPGSTSTKTALFSARDSWNLEEIERRNVKHDVSELEACRNAEDGLEYRSRAVEHFLASLDSPHIDAVAGRGGLTRPLEAGSYRINETMKHHLLTGAFGTHASNYGALIADRLAASRGIPALIADPVGVDQFAELARYSGHPDFPRSSQLHALNMRAVAREAARDLGGEMEDFRFIIAHLGGGISISPMLDGRLVDVNHSMDDGPFPRREAEVCLSFPW